MIRSGAVALGAILALVGVQAGEAADISDLGSYVSSLGGDVFPHMPENWSDLPFRLNASETVEYNSNILNSDGFNNGLLPTSLVGFGKPLGAFESISNFGGSGTYYWGAQQLFMNGSYGFTRYLDHPSFDSAQNNLSIGMNWVFTSRCAGTLVYNQSTSPSAPGDQVSTNEINVASQKSLNETASCRITGNWSGVFNSGVSEASNTAFLDRANNSQQVFASAGITYTVSETNTLQLLATISRTEYPDRGVLLATVINPMLANNIQTSTTQQKINLSYTKNLGPNLAVIASIGAATSSGFQNIGNMQSHLQPQFTLSASWTATPKLSFTASVAQVAVPPTAIIANSQTNQSANVGMNYSITPKLGFAATAGVTRSSGSNNNVSSAALQTFFPNLTNSTNYNLSTTLNYSITPFIGANLSYRYSRSVQEDRQIPTSIMMLALNFTPY